MISPGQLQQIRDQADALGLSEGVISSLRQTWPGLSFTWCSENDIPARLTPQTAGEGYDLYLVSGAEHCVAFTDHLEAATGVVLASKEEDD